MYEKRVLNPLRELPNVRWLPDVDHTELLCNADLLLSTSIAETNPVLLVEAIAANIAVVAQMDTTLLVRTFGTALPSTPGDGLHNVSLDSYVRVLESMHEAKQAGRSIRPRHPFVQTRHSLANFHGQLKSIFGLLIGVDTH